MKKLYAVNFGTRDCERVLVDQITESGNKAGTQVEEINSEDLLFLSGEHERETRVFCNREEIDLSQENTSVFFRKRTKRPAAIALFANLLRFRGIQFNGQANTFHTSLTNKSFQSILLSEQGHRFPKTLVGYPDTVIDHEDLVEKNFTYPFIFKSAGSKGQAVWMVKSRDELREHLGGLEKGLDGLVSIQEKIENDFDMRALVFQGEFIGCYARVRGEHEFLNNLAHGGILKEIKLTDDEKIACCSVAKDSPADLVGIDLIRTRDGHYFLELNRSPEVYPFFDIDNPINIGKRLFDLFNSES